VHAGSKVLARAVDGKDAPDSADARASRSPVARVRGDEELCRNAGSIANSAGDSDGSVCAADALNEAALRRARGLTRRCLQRVELEAGDKMCDGLAATTANAGNAGDITAEGAGKATDVTGVCLAGWFAGS
jgi:hypothetical protein